MRLSWICIAFVLVACQTTQEKNLLLIKDRAVKLQSLSGRRPIWCQVEAHLTQPALARYRELLGKKDLSDDPLEYTWKERRGVCEIVPLEESELVKSHKAFLETAFCMLLQVHFVNSPFADLQFKPDDVVNVGDLVQIRATPTDPALGIYLDPTLMKVETRTKSKGTLVATYAENEKEWLPTRLEQSSPGAHFLIDEIEYDTTRLNGHRMIKSFWISVGDEKPFQHTQVTLSRCQNF